MRKSVISMKGRSARTAVIGLGYVGLPLAVEMARAGYQTCGFDVLEEKVGLLNQGKNYIPDISDATLAQLVEDNLLCATSDFSRLAEADFISICVPTPLGKGKDPDLSFIVAAAEGLAPYLRSGQVIILESTTYPGTTEELVLPLLEKSGLQVGEDFHLAYSPERIDPGNQKFKLTNTPKVIGGVTMNCAEAAQAFYQSFIQDVHLVGSTRAAEMVKLLENTFRAINIGLANEVAIMSHHLGIDVWEVIEAAATKPFGFMPFYPGPGLGGHCIPVDPHYLVWRLKALDYNPRFIQLADEINSMMPALVVDRVTGVLNKQCKSVNQSKVLILGVAYKEDVVDTRESPALSVISLLHAKGAVVDYHDPHIPDLDVDDIAMESVSIEQNIGRYDCVVLITNHSNFDLKTIVEESRAFIDTRNATKNLSGYSEKIVKL